MKKTLSTPLLQGYTYCCLMGLSISPTASIAASQWDRGEFCPISPVAKQGKLPARPADLDQLAVYVEADNALFREQGDSELNGNVFISRDQQKLIANDATYNSQTQDIHAQGNVRLKTPSLTLSSPDARYNLNSGKGTIEQAEYSIQNANAPAADGRGKSQKVIKDGQTRTTLESATYTTCPVGNESWHVQSSNIQLRHDQDTGIARNVTLRVKDVPIFYFPYFSFPLSDARKSGFLTPSIGSDEKSGLKLSAPYYFNLAPNYDLTLYPTWLSKRGLQVGSEFRYLTRQHAGTLFTGVLPNDNEYNDETRYFFDVKNISRFNAHSQLVLKAAGVSDTDYFNDLGSSLAATSVVNLERSLQYTHRNGDWSFSALAQDFQVISGTNPYARLPELKASYTPAQTASGIRYTFNGELTHFTKAGEPDAERFDLAAGFSKKFENEYAYLTPSLKLRHSAYFIDQASNKRFDRTLPSASLDAGLFFERELDNSDLVQTLEPRLFYTYTPYKDQSSLPVFDSSEKTLSFANLFSDNRFTGKDRIADDNRLTLAVTTRFQDQKKGTERFRASIGQSFYFKDRNVTLPGGTAQTDSRSELILEASGTVLPHTTLTGTTFYDTSANHFTSSNIRLNYKDPKQRVLNVGYSRKKDNFESANLSFALPIEKKWNLVGGVERDLMNDRNLETIAGIEYSDCCWKARLAGRKYLLSDNKTYDDAIFVEFELKGLGGFGGEAKSLLKERIYGYE